MRVAGWQVKLERVFAQAAGRRFRWGRHDCCLFAARCAVAITGVDRRSLFAPYRCESEALGILWALGGMRNLLIYAFGEPKPVAFATHGDIVLIDMGMGEQPAVCMGLNSYAPGRRNLVLRPTSSALMAWDV